MSTPAAKPVTSSATVWFNLALLVLKALELFGVIQVPIDTPDSLGFNDMLMGTAIAGNVGLRVFKTERPVKLAMK